ncbi:MAG: hypothetical protein K6F34_07390 [Lachnospiraceae bacterium]|nr:hypothetical protein [Lachnospiraceae bacterium]
MRIVVWICNDHSLEEHVYTADAGEDAAAWECIIISSERFGLRTGGSLFIKISDQCMVRAGDGIKINGSSRVTGDGVRLCGDTRFELVNENGEILKMYLFFSKAPAMRFFGTDNETVITLGNVPGRTISLIDSPFICGLHLMLRCKKGGDVKVRSEEGCYLNGSFIGHMRSVNIGYGDVISAGGLRILCLEDHVGIEYLGRPNPIVRLNEERPNKAMTARTEEFMPAVRSRVAVDESEIELDPPPPPRTAPRQSVFMLIGSPLTMAIPMCLGCGMYIFASRHFEGSSSPMFMYTGLITAVSSAMIGALWGIVNIRHSAKQARLDEEARVRAYTGYIDRCNLMIGSRYRYNRSVMLRNDPDVHCILGAGNASLMLNRRKGDKDLFSYRLGLGSRRLGLCIKVPKERFAVVPDDLTDLPARLKDNYSRIDDVPVCSDIMSNRIQGFLGRTARELEQLFFCMALQIAATTGPELVKMVFLFSAGLISDDIVRILRWLPQARGEEEHYVCTGHDRVQEFLCTFEGIMRAEGSGTERWIIFTDDPKMIPGPVISGENVSILVFANEYASLPGNVSLIIQNDPSFKGMFFPGSDEGRSEIMFDHISPSAADRYARRIAGMCRYVNRAVRPVPSRVTLPELYEKDFIYEDDIRGFWRNNDPANSLRAPIGISTDSRIVSLDLHEKAHGPHGLVAGMTGSGKSELLQTLILSLAVRYPPDELIFFLIDYKGGGMASMFKGLPHLKGSISNLSGNVTDRALLSIRSENELRQKLFLEAQVNSIRDYGRLYREGTVKRPLPHILIIIDEFAELKREHPEFVKELVSVAQVGRSLGIHLILATQKPAGTVDDNIFSNSRFRICLRVQDRQDSNDMLHRPDASYISEPGRAFLQVGNDELFEEFQTAYTMEPYHEGAYAKPVRLIDKNGRRLKECSGQKEEYSGETHFSKLLEEVKECADKERRVFVPELWLEPLDDLIVFDDGMAGRSNEGKLLAGRYDDPAGCSQGDYRISIEDSGHTVICGCSRSGKSTFLQTLIMSALCGLHKTLPDIYIIDYSNGLLSCFRDSIRVGGYINEDTSDRLKGLFGLLEEIMDRRRNVYVDTGLGQRRDRPVLLVIDNYGAFRDKTGCAYDGIMQEIIKSGESYGIYAIMTGLLIGSSDIPQRLFENCRSGICLNMNDRYQYTECLREVHIPVMPSKIRGRGLAFIDGKLLEFQTGIYYSEDESERNRRIKDTIVRLNERSLVNAQKIPFIPKDPHVGDLDEALLGIAVNGLPLGYDTESLRPYVLDISDTTCILSVSGRSGGGINAIRVAAHYAYIAGMNVRYSDGIKDICTMYDEEPEGMIICMDLKKAVTEFYSHGRDEETERRFEGLIKEKKGRRLMVFGLSVNDHMALAGYGIYEKIRAECTGLLFDGGLDRQSIFDLSFLPYSELCRIRPPGCAVVVKKNASGIYRDVMIPGADDERSDPDWSG